MIHGSGPVFLRVFTASPRRFQRAPSQNPGPRNGGTGAKRGELLRSTRFSVAAHLRVCGEDHPDHLTRRLDLLAVAYSEYIWGRPQRVVQRQVPVVVLGGGCVRVVLQQPAHHSSRRAVLRREVQRQVAVVVVRLGAGLRARRP